MAKCRHAHKFGNWKGLQMSGEPVRVDYSILLRESKKRACPGPISRAVIFFLPPLPRFLLLPTQYSANLVLLRMP